VFIVTVVLGVCCVVSAFVMRGRVASRVRTSAVVVSVCLFIFWGPVCLLYCCWVLRVYNMSETVHVPVQYYESGCAIKIMHTCSTGHAFE